MHPLGEITQRFGDKSCLHGANIQRYSGRGKTWGASVILEQNHMVQLQSVESRLEDQPQPRQAERVAPRRTVGGRRSVLMTVTAAIASGVAPVVPFRGRFEAVVMEFQGVGVAGLGQKA